jgi:hypothetical protein
MTLVEPIDVSAGFVCYKSGCFNPAVAKILTSYVCRVHLTSDRQLKLFGGDNETQQQRKEDPGRNPTEQESDAPNDRGQSVQVGGQSEGAFVGAELRPEAAPVQDDSHAGPGDLQIRDVEGVGETRSDVGGKEQGATGEGSQGAQGEAQQEEDFAFPEDDGSPEVLGEEEFGADEESDGEKCRFCEEYAERCDEHRGW